MNPKLKFTHLELSKRRVYKVYNQHRDLVAMYCFINSPITTEEVIKNITDRRDRIKIVENGRTVYPVKVDRLLLDTLSGQVFSTRYQASKKLSVSMTTIGRHMGSRFLWQSNSLT